MTWEEKKVKAELQRQDLDWDEIWTRARLKGLSNTARTFLWRKLHDLLPSNERLNRILPRTNPSNLCDNCDMGAVDSLSTHCFTQCPHTLELSAWLVETLNNIDPTVTPEGIVMLQFTAADDDTELAAVWIIAATLEVAWARRIGKEIINIQLLLGNLRTKVSFMEMSLLHSNACTIIKDLIN